MRLELNPYFEILLPDYQISIASEHRNFVRFLWFKNINNIDYENFDNTKLVEYRFCRILFGLTSSPFLLEATIDKHISEHENTDSLLKDKLKNSLHVDDLNAGADSIEDAKHYLLHNSIFSSSA